MKKGNFNNKAHEFSRILSHIKYLMAAVNN